ncbi:MAG: T9SS type A sorting domain-containing protein [Candidatus Cloacimonetes bacterium]|nr:T9SS type A sorting domain-containing protein [Candidatus Cloacimonadota bacterium]
MKIILTFVLSVFCISLYADNAVDSTRSMNEDHLTAIKNAFNGGDPVAEHYWEEFKVRTPTKDDSLEIEGMRDENLSNSNKYAKEALWGAVGLDTDQHEPPLEPYELLNISKDYLLDPGFDDYLDLDSVWVAFWNGKTCLDLITRNVALMVDMLWYYVEEETRDSLCAKLDSLADTLHYYIDRNKETWGLGDPKIFLPNAPSAAVGYAGCVLGDNYHIDFAKDMIFEYEIPYLADPQYGFLDFVTTNSNYIGQGLTYFGCNIYSVLNVFFTAYLRMYGENLYNRDIVKNTMSNVVNMIRPDMRQLTLDDCYSHVNPPPSSYFSMEEFVQGLFEYYYNNTNNTEADNGIRWYFNEFKNRYNKYPPLVHWHTYFQPVFSYNPDKSICILNDPNYNIPESITNGSYTDEELTVFRSNINTQIDFENSIQMYVNYDNALNPSFHEHSDQTSFQLFAYGKYLLIDPGYKTHYYSNWARNGIHWLHSPYAHNLIIVNPDSSNEVEHLEHDYDGDPNTDDSLNNTITLIKKEPKYRPDIIPAVDVANPAYKEYFITNPQIEKLKIYMDYVIDPIEDDTIRVERNFYFLEKEYFVIMDNVENMGEGYSNIFWNTLHFRPYKYSNNNLNTDDNGTFTLDADDNVKLYGTIGSSTPFYIGVDAEKPFGCYYWNHYHNYQHRRLKAATEAVNTKYLTILIPSESGDNPIYITEGDNYYGVEIYFPSKEPVEKSYYAISDNDLTISFDDVCINSTANFAGLKYRPNYTGNIKVTDFILSEGDSLSYNNIPLFKSVNFVEEILASYGVDLNVIIKSNEQYPAYRIRRQGANLDNFTSIGVENGENGDTNIQNIYYDDEYFYVNQYNFSEGTVCLENTIIVPENVTLYIGSGVEIYGMNPYVKIEVYGDIEIGNNVIFTAEEGESWDGLYLYNTEAEVTMDNVTFERCKLYNESYILILNNSAFINSRIDQYGNKVYISETNFNSSMVYCYYSPGKIGEPDDVEINISDCSFSNYIGYPVYISGYDLYNLDGNTISGCNGGFYIFKSGHPKMCLISNNSIINNYGKGIFLYDSFADILGHNSIKENSVGIVGAQNCTITIIGNKDYQYQTIKDNICQEMVFDFTSFPKEREMYYNKIIDDDIGGSYDQYLISCANYTGDPRDLIVEDNYWGPLSHYWTEWTGDDRFDPSDAFDYIPVWDPGTTRSPGGSPPEQLFAEADSLIVEEDYEQAKLVYKDIIELYPESDFTIYSMRNLLPLETVSCKDFSSLQAYYLTNPNCNYNPERTKLSEFLANHCNIKMKNYPDAISFFEDIILNHETELDSVYAVIDAGYTYMLMEDDSTKSSYVGKIPELKPKSVLEFEETRDKLLAKALGLPEQYEEEIVPETTFYLGQNYPNPMRSLTNISFSIPKDITKAELKIYNIKGQLVRKFLIGNDQSSIVWDGKNEKGNQLSNGIYLYRLKAGKKSFIKKMILMR